MEHIAEAMDVLQRVMLSIDPDTEPELLDAVSRARDELQRAREQGAEVLLELLNLSERQALMQTELAELRTHPH